LNPRDAAAPGQETEGEVHIMAGEPSTSLPEQGDASHRRDRIKLLLTSMTEQTSKVVAILEEAEANEDHLILGYKSWTAYIAGEYAGLLSDLKLAQRREVVGSLTAIGMSTRAIAGVVGTSHKTVVKDLQVQVVPEVPPDLVDHQDLIRSTGNTCRDCGERMLPSRDLEPNCKTCRDES
jgi:hypothetical protein